MTEQEKRDYLSGAMASDGVMIRVYPTKWLDSRMCHKCACVDLFLCEVRVMKAGYVIFELVRCSKCFAVYSVM